MEEFNFLKTNPALNITTDYLLLKIGDSTLWRYYYGNFKLGQAYPSTFRRDSNPSTSFYINKRGLITLIDYATEERLDCFNFVRKSYGLTFKETLTKIATDFGILKSNIIIPRQVFIDAEIIDKDQKQRTLIQFTQKPWDKESLLYWRFYEITQEMLEREHIYPIKDLFINHKFIPNPNNYQRYAIIVTWKEDGKLQQGVKVLSPNDPKMKWISSVPLAIIGDLEELPHLDSRVFLAKSKKDKVILNSIFTDTCWTQNEGSGCFPESIQIKLLNEYKEAYIVYGSDPQGVQASSYYTPKGFKWINTPKDELKWGVNDPAEYCKRYGREKLIEFFKQKGFL